MSITLPYESVDRVHQILDMDKYNGRVNLVEPADKHARFRMQEKVHIRNTASNYYEALNGELELNVLSQVFFSAENIQIIQNGLRAGVHAMSEGRFMVPNQNLDTLKIIMRSIYLQYAQNIADRITEEVERLNTMVLDYAVPNVYGEAVAYMNYIRDQSTLVSPMQMPQKSDRVYKQLELKPYF
jgi:hypothetical protein